INVESIPISFNDYSFLVELDSQLTKTREKWNYTLDNFLIQETSGTLISNPRLQLSGICDNYGFTSSSLVYSDTVGSLEGSLGAGWDFSDRVLHSAFLDFSAAQTLFPESLNLRIRANNPERADFSSTNFLSKLFFNAEAQINEFKVGHILKDQKIDDTVSCSINFLGSIDMPSVQIMVDRAKMRVGNESLLLSGMAHLEDKEAFINNAFVSYASYQANDISGFFNFDTMSGTADLSIAGELDKNEPFSTKHFETPISVSFKSFAKKRENYLQDFSVDLILKKLRGNFFNDRDEVPVHLEKNNNRTSFYIGSSQAFSGVIESNGEIHLLATKDFPVSFKGDGIIQNNEINVFVDDIYIDVAHFSALLDIDVFSAYGGVLTGQLMVSESIFNPLMNGTITGKNLRVSSPICLDEVMYTDLFKCHVQNSRFIINDAFFIGEKSGGQFILDYTIVLEDFSEVIHHLDAKSVNDKAIYAYFELPIGYLRGAATTQLSLDITPSFLDLRGVINVHELDAVVSSLSFQEEDLPAPDSLFETQIDLLININPKSRVYFPSKQNPVIRGLVGQEKPIYFTMDSASNTYSLSGDLVVRGGEVLYINRTFYIREGKVSLSGNQDDFDPVLSFRAEIRDHDDNGDLVKIILTAIEQRLSQLSPVLTSIPSKSQTELMGLLGQAVLGDFASSNSMIGNVLAGALDYGLQISVFRGVENALRDFLNFDIFSFRTTFLQNAMVQAFIPVEDDTNVLSFGNYLDGSTVYIGKYIGDTLYADMMLEIVYDKTFDDKGTMRGLGFKPEIGLEFPSPFATIRWSIAPDVSSDWNLLVPYTSISLSWKYVL
ncbi:MAG TPA: translocation/assembly module TamB domain-containing protein, partial [Treponemataceae bacterium]|nr:translocation/assembly module TamB domain-containing protein [Treponemataceae bacterium]